MEQKTMVLRAVCAGMFLAAGVLAAGTRSAVAQREIAPPATSCGLYGGPLCSKTTTCLKLPGTDAERCSTSYAYYRG